MKAGKSDEAIAALRAFLKSYPRNDYADNAQYWLGETYYAQGKYRDAVTAYDRVIADYANSAKVPDAYYKRGLSYRELGMKDQAREDFQYVIKTFPDNTLAPLAKAALDSIK